MTIVSLQAEHHESGFGIAHPTPRLTWRFGSTTLKDWKQASYELVISRAGDHQAQHYSIKSEQSVLVSWPSKPIQSREIVLVKVRSIGTDGSTTNWAEITLEAALLDRGEWKAKFISGPAQEVDAPKTPFRLRKIFVLKSAPVQARLYATALGVYECEINGKRVGDQVLAPGWTSYKYHLRYQVYDISPFLQQGENTITAYVGEGWYATRLGRPGKRNNWGSRLGFLGQLEADGEAEVLTDETWECIDGPIKNSEIYNGEVYDSKYHESKAKISPIEVLPFPEAQLIASDAPPVRRVKEVKAVELITSPSGKFILDFGQNLVGFLRIEKDLKGKELLLRHAEVLEDGKLGTRPLRTAGPNDKIILGGKTKGWEPKFTFHGFRYVEILGIKPTLEDFTAIVIFSDMRRTGTFTSSHEMVNRLHENTVWGMMSNFVSVPTDCPQRDERLGWTGDIQVFAPTANYLFDTSAFLEGWLQDVAAEQIEWKGVPPTVVPYVPPNKFNDQFPKPQSIWADVVAITPWDLYNTFGDKKIMEKQWGSMCLWLDEGVPRGKNGLWSEVAPQYGDWLDPNAPPQYPAHGRTDTHFVANAYLIYVTSLVAKIGKLLKKDPKVVKKYEDDAARLHELFLEEYTTPTGRVVSDTQTALALALKFNLLKAEQIPRAQERLEFLTKWAYFKVSTGFAGTPILLPVLADNGLEHIAYRMLQEKDNPSWLYSVGMGATTIWERWDSMLPDGRINPGQMTSFNHYALGAVAQFMHTYIGGLSPSSPGWKSALIKPLPGGTITSAQTSFDSPYGRYACRWKIEGNTMLVDTEVPPNGSARVVLNEIDEVIGSGKQRFKVLYEEDKRWPPKGIRGPQSVFMPDEFVP